MARRPGSRGGGRGGRWLGGQSPPPPRRTLCPPHHRPCSATPSCYCHHRRSPLPSLPFPPPRVCPFCLWSPAGRPPRTVHAAAAAEATRPRGWACATLAAGLRPPARPRPSAHWPACRPAVEPPAQLCAPGR
ncbi:hypothetical protein I4F81_006324 [Pyropia yezoensis]|uniref:Uncharacterized protein n=1 Tax=Pyropia yezoensis TaxID=2788 RepID=A0ACC3C0Y1_PYRYE|nr:hypothetical protein I4F81_006324 [Neopyropia yezoensis]